jgi:hypothetical protein
MRYCQKLRAISCAGAIRESTDVDLPKVIETADDGTVPKALRRQNRSHRSHERRNQHQAERQAQCSRKDAKAQRANMILQPAGMPAVTKSYERRRSADNSKKIVDQSVNKDNRVLCHERATPNNV